MARMSRTATSFAVPSQNMKPKILLLSINAAYWINSVVLSGCLENPTPHVRPGDHLIVNLTNNTPASLAVFF
jgi:hypothetical protein